MRVQSPLNFMSKTFLMSDHHLGHDNICRMQRADGTPLRPFSNAEEMFKHLRDQHNSVVSPQDRVYMMGDVSIKRRTIELVQQFNGRKVLIKGNHDIFKIGDYLPWFDDIRAAVVKANYIITHVPVHEGSKARFAGNLHGHTHSNVIADPWWFNCCPEVIGYVPLTLDQIIKQHQERLKSAA